MKKAYSDEALQSYKTQMIDFIKNDTVSFRAVQELEMFLRKNHNLTIFTDFDLLDLSKVSQ